MRTILFLTLFIPFLTIAQDIVIQEGLPKDLDQSKIIFFKHEKIKVTADPTKNREEKYIHLRQINHNKVAEEANEKLKGAAMEYPFQYALSTKSAFEPLIQAGYQYILDSRVYNYEYLDKQPAEGELIVYEYFIVDVVNNLAYKVFELDEMKVYDSRLMIRRLNKELKKVYPEAFN